MAAKISVWRRARALQRQSVAPTTQPRMRGDDKLMMSGAEQRTAVEHRADAYSPAGLGMPMRQMELPPQSTRGNDQEDAAGRSGKLGLLHKFCSKRCR